MASEELRGRSAVPPAWYADPVGRNELRYWDGARWTEHVHGVVVTVPPSAVVVPDRPHTSTPAVAAPEASRRMEPRASFWDKLETVGALIAAAVFIFVVVVLPLGFGIAAGWLAALISHSTSVGIVVGISVAAIAVMVAWFMSWLDGIL